MNKQRRNRTQKVIDKLETLKFDDKQTLKECIRELEDIRMDEEIAFDGMPENLQSSMRGEESEEALDSLQDAIDYLDEIDNADSFGKMIEDAISCLDFAWG